MLEQIAERYYARVRGLVQNRLRLDFRRSHGWMSSAFSTGDVVQGVFLRVLGSVKNVQSTTEEAFIGYLATAVENQILDTMRHHQAGIRDARLAKKSESAELEALSKAAPDATPSHDAAQREQFDALRSVVRTLTTKQRRVWELRSLDHLPFAEIAEELGYASADVARQAYNETKARVLVAMRRRGFGRTRSLD